MLSFIPFASGPHAAVWASRVASASEAAEAVALFWCPLNATVTEHSTRWEERVDQRRNAAKATRTSSDRNLPGAVMFASYRDPAAGSRPRRNQVTGPAVLLPTGRKEREVARGYGVWNVRKCWFGSGNIWMRSSGRKRPKRLALISAAVATAIPPIVVTEPCSHCSRASEKPVQLPRLSSCRFGAGSGCLEGFPNPIQIPFIAMRNRKRDDLRHLIRMQLAYAALEVRQTAYGGFHVAIPFLSVFHTPVPEIRARHRPQDLGARGEPIRNDCLGQPFGGRLVG
jgi:hypothetical protein